MLDANKVLHDPVAVLGAFCTQVGLAFDPHQEICWPSGQHASDGAWAPLWYQKVFRTTGLKPYTSTMTEVPDSLQPVVDACMPTYEKLYQECV